MSDDGGPIIICYAPSVTEVGGVVYGVKKFRHLDHFNR
jgi:hypothetical protein